MPGFSNIVQPQKRSFLTGCFALDLHVEGLFRVPGNSLRQQTLREQLNGGADIDFASGDFHPNDVATLLKSFLGELPEPLLTQRHLHAHLKITGLCGFSTCHSILSIIHCSLHKSRSSFICSSRQK